MSVATISKPSTISDEAAVSMIGDHFVSVMQRVCTEFQPAKSIRFLPERDVDIFDQFARRSISNQFNTVLEFVDFLRSQKPEASK